MDNRRSDQPRAAAAGAARAAEPGGGFQLPPGVHEKHGRYFLIRKNQWHPLTRRDEGTVPFWRAYYRLTHADPDYVAGLLLAYLEEAMGELAPATRSEYEKYIITRLIPYFGQLHRHDLNSSHVAMYLEDRKQAGAPIGANRERACLSSACNFGMRKGWLTSNPCLGVARNKERPSQRYVEHDELIKDMDRAPPELYPLMGIAYVLGIRQTDLRLLTKTQDTGKLLKVTESKTGKPNEHEITKTVRFLLNKAAEHREAVAKRYDEAADRLESLSQYHRAERQRAKAQAVRAEPHIFLSKRGLPWSVWGLQSALRRFGAAFRFRDLRPKAETDRAGVLGHTGQMQRSYTRVRRLKAVK